MNKTLWGTNTFWDYSRTILHDYEIGFITFDYGDRHCVKYRSVDGFYDEMISRFTHNTLWKVAKRCVTLRHGILDGFGSSACGQVFNPNHCEHNM